MIYGGEGEEVGAVENAGEVVYAVEERDEIGECSDEADDELGEDDFGDIFARPSLWVSEIVRG